jgi:hypothetical protein
MVSTSAWVAGCSTLPLGLLVPVIARRGSVDVHGWVIWGYVCGLDGCLNCGGDLTFDCLG